MKYAWLLYEVCMALYSGIMAVYRVETLPNTSLLWWGSFVFHISAMCVWLWLIATEQEGRAA